MRLHALENGPCHFESAAASWFHGVQGQGQGRDLPLLHGSLISSVLSD